MSARKPGTVPATGISGPLNGPQFLPYARGRAPERVLAAISAGLRPESVQERFARELAAERGHGCAPGHGGRPRKDRGEAP